MTSVLRDSSGKADRLHFTCSGYDELSEEESRRWFELIRKHKMIPKYLKVTIKNKKTSMIIRIKGLPLSLLYAHISTVRFTREEPGFVRTMLHLVDKFKMDFYAAYVLSSKIRIGNSWHNIIPMGSYCPDKIDPNEIDVPFEYMRALYLFFKNPKKYDERSSDGVTSYTSDYSSNRIEKLARSISRAVGKIPLKGKDLFDPAIAKAIRAQTNPEAKKYLRKVNKEKQNGKSKGRRNSR
jgi:hypothetical protein